MYHRMYPKGGYISCPDEHQAEGKVMTRPNPTHIWSLIFDSQKTQSQRLKTIPKIKLFSEINLGRIVSYFF